jgi:hypothetical protein
MTMLGLVDHQLAGRHPLDHGVKNLFSISSYAGSEPHGLCKVADEFFDRMPAPSPDAADHEQKPGQHCALLC